MELKKVVKILASNNFKRELKDSITYIIDTLFDEIPDRIKGILYYGNEDMCDPLDDFYYNEFKIYYGKRINGVVKNYKYRPNIPDDTRDKYIDRYGEKSFYSLIDMYIEDFYNNLKEKLERKFKAELVVLGKGGGYWGISTESAYDLIELDNKFVDKFERTLKNSNFLRKFWQKVVDEDYDFDNKEEYKNFILDKEYIEDYDDNIISYIFNNYDKDEIYDYSKLYKCLDYIDKVIKEKEKTIIKDIKERVKEEEK